MTIVVYAVFDCSEEVGRNVATELPADSVSPAGTTVPSAAESMMFAAFAPVTLAGSIGSENVTTTPASSETFVDPSDGRIEVTRGGCATRCRSSGSTSFWLAKVTAPVARSDRTRSFAVNVAAPITPVAM